MNLRFFPVLVMLFVGVFFGAPVGAVESPVSEGQALLSQYAGIEPKMESSVFGMPIYLASSEEGGTSHVDIYGVVDYPFDQVSGVIASPANWCDITLLHVNVKACTSQKEKNAWLLTLYSGRKHYQEPDEAYELKYLYRVLAQQPDYLSLLLTAEQGPLSTKDYRIVLKAIPLNGSKTLIHLSYRFSYGFFGRMAMKTYFATIGSGKIGFSVVGKDDDGKPVYVGGIKGAIERNVVRYFYAIRAYIDVLRYPKEQQFEKRLNRWFDLTDRHKKQLFELEKEEYLSNKRLEYKNQLLLQKKLSG